MGGKIAMKARVIIIVRNSLREENLMRNRPCPRCCCCCCLLPNFMEIAILVAQCERENVCELVSKTTTSIFKDAVGCVNVCRFKGSTERGA
jgi:hypothetical protein